jgi:hypothetical protein
MTFESGKCTQVMSGLLAQTSVKVTITDCHGNELQRWVDDGIGLVLLIVCVGICCCVGCVCMCMKQFQRRPAAGVVTATYSEAPLMAEPLQSAVA